MFYIDDILQIDNSISYGVFVNGIPCSNVKYSTDYVSADFIYNFYGEEDEVLLHDNMAIRIGLYNNSTYIYIRTNGGSNAVNYWNKYFEKNNIEVEIRNIGYKTGSELSFVDGSVDQNNLAYARYYNADEEMCYLQTCYKGETVSFPFYNELDKAKFSGWSTDKKQEITEYVIKEDTAFYACYNVVLSNDEYLDYALKTMKNGVLILDAESVTHIPDGYFRNNLDIIELKILPESGTTAIDIEKNAFYGCKNLKKVNSFTWVGNIGECAFYDTGLTEISLFWDNTLEDGAFDSCVNLKTVEINYYEDDILHNIYGLEVLPERAFANCSKLEKVILPESLKTVKMSAFTYCTSLKKIFIPSSVTKINSNVFYGCSTSLEIQVPYDKMSELPSGFDDNFNTLNYSDSSKATIKLMGKDKNGLNYVGLARGYWNVGGTISYNPAICVCFSAVNKKPFTFKSNQPNTYTYTKQVGGFVGTSNREETIEINIIDNNTVEIVNISNVYGDFETKTFTYTYDSNGKYLTDVDSGKVLTWQAFESNLEIVL